jgi:hypothetical protein
MRPRDSPPAARGSGERAIRTAFSHALGNGHIPASSCEDRTQRLHPGSGFATPVGSRQRYRPPRDQARAKRSTSRFSAPELPRTTRRASRSTVGLGRHAHLGEEERVVLHAQAALELAAEHLRAQPWVGRVSLVRRMRRVLVGRVALAHVAVEQRHRRRDGVLDNGVLAELRHLVQPGVDEVAPARPRLRAAYA